MNGSFILDTNIVIALFANEDFVLKEISKAREIYLPAIVVGELFYGAYNSGKADQNIQTITEFARHVNFEMRPYYRELLWPDKKGIER